MAPPGVLVGRAGRGKAAGDLSPARVSLRQRRRERDAGTGNLHPGRMSQLQRRGDGDYGGPRLPEMAATTAVSTSAPLSMVMVSPLLKPSVLPTGITVAPTSVAVPMVLPPAVPTVAMTAVSGLARPPPSAAVRGLEQDRLSSSYLSCLPWRVYVRIWNSHGSDDEMLRLPECRDPWPSPS